MELGKVLGKGPLPLDLVRIGDTASDTHPNAGATWSSTGSESACAVRPSTCCKLYNGALATACFHEISA